MKKLTLQEKQKTADALLRRISELHTPGERVRLMEVCGTHTVSIFREGVTTIIAIGNRKFSQWSLDVLCV